MVAVQVPVFGPAAVMPFRERAGRWPMFRSWKSLAVLAAGFTPGEADQLRRAMAAWKRKGGLEKYRAKLVDGMTVAQIETLLRGNTCGPRPTSCADQLVRALREAQRAAKA